MSVHNLKNKIEKRLKQNKTRQHFKDVGSFIKKRRIELNQTQDVVSNGICSISYLSKVENNQIEPNQLFIREIMEKLDVKEDAVNTFLEDHLYLEASLNAFFYHNEEELENIYFKVKEIKNNLVINITKLMYYVYKEDEDPQTIVMMLEHLTSNMSDFEVKVYLLLAAIYFYLEYKYKIALEFLILAEKIPHKNQMLTGLIHEYLYYVKQSLLKKNASYEHYTEASRVFMDQHAVSRMVHLSIEKAYFLHREHPKKSLEILDAIYQVREPRLKEHYEYVKALTYFELGEYKKSSILLKDIDISSKYYMKKMVLLYRICEKEEDYNTIEDIKVKLKNFHPKRFELREKIEFHLLELTDSKERKIYLKDIAIPFSIKINDFDNLIRYIKEITDICIDTSRYKEGLLYVKKLEKEQMKIDKILML